MIEKKRVLHNKLIDVVRITSANRDKPVIFKRKQQTQHMDIHTAVKNSFERMMKPK